MLLAEFRTWVNLTGFHVFALMHVFAQIFYFCTGSDAFSQKIERSLCILFSDSCVLYSCSCHVLLAEFRTLANLTGFHVFALMHVFAHIFYFCTGGDAFSQKIERSLSIFFSDSFVVYSCGCHVLLAESPLSELILRFVISCYISRDVSLCVPYC